MAAAGIAAAEVSYVAYLLAHLEQAAPPILHMLRESAPAGFFPWLQAHALGLSLGAGGLALLAGIAWYQGWWTSLREWMSPLGPQVLQSLSNAIDAGETDEESTHIVIATDYIETLSKEQK